MGRAAMAGIPLALALAFAPALGACDRIAPAGPIEPADCFGDVPYSFRGWTTLGALGVDGDPGARVYALVTRDEIQLAHSPATPSGPGFWVVGRAVCWTEAAGTITREAFGPTRNVPAD